MLGPDVPSSRTSPRDRECVDGELWEGASGVGALTAVTGEDCVALERVSADPSCAEETFVPLLDTTLGCVTLLAAGGSPIND